MNTKNQKKKMKGKTENEETHNHVDNNSEAHSTKNVYIST